MAFHVTAAELQTLTDSQLEELDSRLTRLYESMSSPAYRSKGPWAEEVLALIGAEQRRRRGIPAKPVSPWARRAEARELTPQDYTGQLFVRK